jgi:hypothetical protein
LGRAAEALTVRPRGSASRSAMLFGDAKASVSEITEELKAQ